MRPSPSEWVQAARPRTLPAAVVPVAVGIAIAEASSGIHWWRAVLALLVALCIQIGTNYANDYSDGIRGTDTKRVGPTRLVAGGLAEPKLVLIAALSVFGLAAILGLVAALLTSPYLLVVGAASIAAGWFYTGGKHPYGYAGYGEVFVFVFFGLVCVVGSTYVTAGTIPVVSYFAAVSVGLVTVALLIINNLRDIPTDAATGKRTLAVVMGDGPTRSLYITLIVVAFVALAPIAYYRHLAPIALVAVFVAIKPIAIVRKGTVGGALIPALAETGALLLVFGLMLAIGIAL